MFELRFGMTSVPPIPSTPFKMLEGKSDPPATFADFLFFFFFFFFPPKLEVTLRESSISSSRSAPITIYGYVRSSIIDFLMEGPVIIVPCKFLIGLLVLVFVEVFLSSFFLGMIG